MPTRSQRHMREIRPPDSGGRYNPPKGPAISGVGPATATAVNIGTVGRTLYTVAPTGGTAPFTVAITAAGGMSLSVVGLLVKTAASPIAATTGVKTLTLKVTDVNRNVFNQTVAVTLT